MIRWRPATAALTLVAQALFAGAAAAQTTSSEEIVVTGSRVEEAIRDFVTELSAPPPAEDQLARWNREVCVGVIGIRARYGQFLVDRISQRAHDIGLQPGAAGCRANVVVFVTQDSQALAETLATQFRNLMGDTQEDNLNTQGDEALAAFVNAPRPVRWWHVSNTVTEDGQVLRDVQASNSAQGLRGQVVRRSSMGFGRLSRTTRQDFSRVVIIVDATAAAGMQFDSLADYVAMVALAQVNPDADVSDVDTILNLFGEAGEAAPTAMTEWDLAYLDGLYNARRNARNSRAQEAEIARRMGETVRGEPE